MPIHLLSPELASQIAAGEVVERPASVVKELLENALDAGAGQVRIEVVEGGRASIRVADNGAGIPAAEVQLAFERHATSKIDSVDDLARVSSLGFRGEALASIASVSHLTCVTRARDEEVGSRLRLEGSQLVEHKSIGAPAGTLMTVEHLFYNVPARLKFLKSVSTERRHIDTLVTRYAMAYPDVRFHLSHDGRLAFQTHGSSSLHDVLIAIYGAETAQQLLPVSNRDEPDNTCVVSGYVSLPALTRANRNELTFFVNGRWVQDRSIAYAVIQAYHTMLQVNRYPLCSLHIELPPEELDVNVHPAKSEVRFRNSDAVFRAVQKTVRQALIGEQIEIERSDREREGDRGGDRDRDRERQLRLRALDVYAPSRVPAVEPGLEQAAGGSQALPAVDLDAGRPPAGPGALSPTAALPPLRVVGQIDTTYIVAEGPAGLYLVDQHAAHERVLYEQFMGQLEGMQLAVQHLLNPLPIELTPIAVSLIEEKRELLARVGFELESFGGNTFLLRSVPAVLARSDLRQVINDVLAELDAGEMPLASSQEARLVRRVCKQAAIKAGQVLSTQEMQELIRQLEKCVAPRTCPHGRPTMIHLSHEQLARQFGRH
ncbi:MAG: DNA mismatch repair endonuclease MutL [Thermoflexales bacterium]|nr:DNA mismatch repair endonuclease MutL [Thermoflexales bacterium]